MSCCFTDRVVEAGESKLVVFLVIFESVSRFVFSPKNLTFSDSFFLVVDANLFSIGGSFNKGGSFKFLLKQVFVNL